jgi:HD-GYP domain-containing protein (c-di-GMP phosphodiesterase class II)
VGWSRFMQAGCAVTDPGQIVRDLNWCGDDAETGQHMYAPLGSGDHTLGVIVTGRRRKNGSYKKADLVQLTILADVAKAALQGMSTSVGRTIEAVRLLLKIRRTGVPTSTPQALDLLAKLARRLGVGETGARRIQYAAALHDAGMARVEDEIVLGDASLNMDERDEVERHVEEGVELMSPLLPDEATTDIMRHHHEKFDGTGYPKGLKGPGIPLGARLLAVIDAWFSLTRERPFRQGLSPVVALAEITSHTGTQFDPQVVREFKAVLVSENLLGSNPQKTGPHAN